MCNEVLTKLQVSSSVQLDHVGDLVLDEHDGFTLPLLDSFLSKGLHTVKSIPLKCRLSLQLVREALAEPSTLWSNIDEENLDLHERNVKQCKRKICDSHYTTAVRVLSSSGIAPYNQATLEDLKAKHPFKHAPSLPYIPIDHHQLIASPDMLVDSIAQVVNLFLDGKCPKMLGEYIASAPLTPLVKPGGGIHPIAVGTVWRRLISKVSTVMIGHSLDSCLNYLQLGVGVSNEGRLYFMLKIAFIILLFQVGWNFVTLTQLDCIMGNTPYGRTKIKEFFTLSFQAWYLDDGTIIGETLEDPRSRLAGVFPPNIGQPGYGVKLLGGLVSVDFDYSSELVVKRVAKTIELMDDLIVTASGLGFGDWKWRLATLPFAFGGLGVYFAGDILNYAFLASRLQSASLQTKLLRHSGIVASGLPLKMPIGLDVCVDLTGSSPVTQTGMTDFEPGHAVIDAAKRRRVKTCTCHGRCITKADNDAVQRPLDRSSCAEMVDEDIDQRPTTILCRDHS
ncbi:hypothetical protein Tco_1104113 [Tanacetum coccineum]